MSEDRRVWVGDEVEVPAGRGVVLEVMTWRKKIEGMRETQAKAFSDQCRREVGPEFATKWGEVLVKVGKKTKWWPIAQVKVVEGRDGKTVESRA